MSIVSTSITEDDLQSNEDNQLESVFNSSEHKAAFNVAISEALLRIEQIKELLIEVVHFEFDEEKCACAIHNLNDIAGVISVIDLDAPTELLAGICAYVGSDRFKRNVEEGADALQDLADCVVSLQCYFEQIELRVPYAEQILDYSKQALKRISGPERADDEADNISVDESMPAIDLEFSSEELREPRPKINRESARDTEIEQGFDLLPDLNNSESELDELDFQLEEDAFTSEDQSKDNHAQVVELQDKSDIPLDSKLTASESVEQPTISNESTEESVADTAQEVRDAGLESDVQPSKQVTSSAQNTSSDFELKVLTDDSDPDVLETYIEEATQVIFDMKQYWDKWKKNQQDWQSFIDVRRGFHTLKGSGRFAGAQLLGEFAWSFENLCNKLISKKDFVPPEKQALLVQALEIIPELIEQLKNRDRDVSADVLALIQQVQESASDNKKITSKEEQQVTEDEEENPEDTLQKELTGIFSAEATQHLSVMRDAIEQQYDKSKQIRIDDDLLRTIHTLRGSARTAGADSISQVCAYLEDIVALAIKHDTNFNEEQVQLIQSCLMQIELALQDLKVSGKFSDIDSELVNRLNQFSQDLSAQYESVDVVVDAQPQVEVESDDQAAMVDIHGDRDEELCEIFFEEAEDVLGVCQNTLQRLKSNYEDAEALSELRRQLHTLKGSSRMAGYATIGELSHVTETLLVSLVDRRKEFNDDILSLLQRVVDAAHVKVDAAQAGQDIHLDQSLVNDVLAASGAKVSESTDLADKKADKPVPEPVVEMADAHLEELIEPSSETDDIKQEAIVDEAKENSLVKDAEEIAAVESSEVELVGLKSFSPEELAENHSENDKREVIRVPADVLDGLVNDAGEVNILHSRLEQVMQAQSFSIKEFDQTVSRLHEQLRKLEIETEAQILFKHAEEQEQSADFDPLELDRYSDIQQLSRALAESVEDLLNIKEMLSGYTQNWEDILVQQHVVTNNLQDNLLHTRMVKFASIEPRLQRIVRQTSEELDKQIELSIIGGENEIDRSVLNRILAPIEHILRNSVGHGIESPQAREKQGKPAIGSVKLEIKRESSEIIIVIKDDGVGIDPARVKAKAIEKGLIGSDDHLSKEDILKLILKSGFSTANEVTRIAGRGVGMDVVDKEIRSLGGALRIQSNLGKGASFVLRLPFTLAVSQALLVQAGKEIYALTLSGIEGVIRLPAREIRKIAAQPQSSYTYAGHEYMFYHLGSLLQSGSQSFEDDSELYPMLLVRVGEQRLALQLEASLGNKEIVVKPLASQIVRSQGISGATILGDGRVALILDIPWIARLTQSKNYTDAAVISDAQEQQKDDESTVMVVDDSITIRKVTTRFLERNNYKAVTAKDGVDALQKLQKMIPNLILLDIEMPRMDGYELAAQIRKDQRLSKIPIIMITSRTGDKHRNRAKEVGVERYLGKPYNESELLAHIKDLQLEV